MKRNNVTVPFILYDVAGLIKLPNHSRENLELTLVNEDGVRYNRGSKEPSKELEYRLQFFKKYFGCERAYYSRRWPK